MAHAGSGAQAACSGKYRGGGEKRGNPRLPRWAALWRQNRGARNRRAHGATLPGSGRREIIPCGRASQPKTPGERAAPRRESSPSSSSSSRSTSSRSVGSALARAVTSPSASAGAAVVANGLLRPDGSPGVSGRADAASSFGCVCICFAHWGLDDGRHAAQRHPGPRREAERLGAIAYGWLIVGRWRAYFTRRGQARSSIFLGPLRRTGPARRIEGRNTPPGNGRLNGR